MEQCDALRSEAAPLSSRGGEPCPEGAGAARLTCPGLSVCVINYQGRGVIGATLDAIRRLEPGPAEVILVDNASTDDGVAFVRAAYPEVTVLAMPDNRGPGPARDAGYRAAKGRFVALVDNDVMPAPDCLALLTRALVEHEAALAMPRVLYAAAPETIQFDGADAHFLGVMAPRATGTPLAGAPDRTVETGSLITACFVVDRERWGALQLQDPAFFIYHEDHDLGLRARQLGLKLVQVPQAVVLHGDGTPGLSIRATGMFTQRRVVLTIANRWRVLLTRYEGRTLVLLAPALLAFEAFQLGGAVAKGWLGHWWTAVRTLARDLPTTLRERRAWRRQRVVGDGAVLVDGPLPFHPRLLDGRIERQAARLLAAITSGNWRLVRPLLNHGRRP